MNVSALKSKFPRIIISSSLIFTLCCGLFSANTFSRQPKECKYKDYDSLVNRGLVPFEIMRVLPGVCDRIVSSLSAEGLTLNQVNLLYPGRSLPLIQAALELSVPGVSSRAFPMSFNRRYKHEETSPEQKQQLTEHFNRYIGFDNIANKPTVILDFLGSGRSMINLVHYLNTWLKEGGVENPRIIAMGLGDSDFDYSYSIGEKIKPTNFYQIGIETKYEFFMYIYNGYYDLLSPVIEYDIFKPPRSARLIEKYLKDKKVLYGKFKHYLTSVILKNLPEHGVLSTIQFENREKKRKKPPG